MMNVHIFREGTNQGWPEGQQPDGFFGSDSDGCEREEKTCFSRLARMTVTMDINQFWEPVSYQLNRKSTLSQSHGQAEMDRAAQANGQQAWMQQTLCLYNSPILRDCVTSKQSSQV